MDDSNTACKWFIASKFPDLPNPKKIPNPENAGPKTQIATIINYEKARNILWYQCGDECVDRSSGMIKDKYFLALIILLEFGGYKKGDPNAYGESLEGLSNEYYSAVDLNYKQVGGMACYGSCTIEEQMEWLYEIEAVRKDDFIRLINEGQYKQYLDDAMLAMVPGGYTYGNLDSTWHWGETNHPEYYCVTAQTYSLYDGLEYYVAYSCKNQPDSGK